MRDRDAGPAGPAAAADVQAVESAPPALPGAVLARLAQAPPCARAAMAARLRPGTSNAGLMRALSTGALGVAREEEGDLEADAVDPVELQQLPGAPAAAPQPAAAPSNRPAPTTTTIDCDDCNAAVAVLNSKAFVGEAYVKAQWAGTGNIETKKSGKTWTASVGIAWTIDPTLSSMQLAEFKWPNMTTADTAAVAAFKTALQAHEEGHFTAVEAAIAKLPKTISASASTEKAAVAKLKDPGLPDAIAAGQAAIDAATAAYDKTTAHGKTQSAVGGTNVTLTCPPPPKTP